MILNKYVCLLLLYSIPHISYALEGITNFDADITVNPDASLEITETIDITAEGHQLKHGIFRDLPIQYKNENGQLKSVDFDIIGIHRDNVPSQYTITYNKNIMRILIGLPESTLPPGHYQYVIHYKTSNQILYFKNYDELIWNVTGYFWTLPIDIATATVRLPSQAKIQKYTAYTGFIGEKNHTYTATQTAPNIIQFTTTQALPPKAGFTVTVTFPKGFVTTPPLFTLNNILNGSLYTGLLLVLCYYLFGWNKIRKNPNITISPQFYPPENLSPAAISYIYHMGLKKNSNLSSAFTATLVEMAIKNYLRLKPENHDFILEPEPLPSDELNPEHQSILDTLKPPILINKKYNPVIETALNNLKSIIEKQYHQIYFHNNTDYFLLGLTLSIVILGSFFVLHSPSNEITWLQWLTIGAFIPLNILFARLLRARTLEGAKTFAEIKGFLMYLTTAEEIRLKNLTPPEITSQIFEQYLPYAIALGVEQQWGDAFAKTADYQPYQPIWYAGKVQHDEFIHRLNSLSTFLTAAAIEPSSSANPPSSTGSSGSNSGGAAGGGGW